MSCNRPTRLGEICELKYGKSLPEAQRESGPYSVYGSSGRVGFHKEAFTSGRTIIVGRKGSIGAVTLSSDRCWPIDTTYYIDESCTSAYLPWLGYLLSTLKLHTFNRAAAVPGLNREDAYGLSVLVPPLPEQRRIAAILDQADALRTMRRQAGKKLDRFRESTFVHIFGDPISNPNRWPIRVLGELFDFRTGKLDSNAAVANGAYPFFTCSREDSTIDTYAFDCEALLLAGNNAAGEYSVKHFKGKFNAYQRTYVITARNHHCAYPYALIALQHKLGELKRVSKGTSTRYLTLDILQNLRIQLPPIDFQEQFQRSLSPIEDLQCKNEAALIKLDTLFASLQHRAFRGEL